MGTASANRKAIWDREKTERANRPRLDKPQGYSPPPKRVYNLHAGASWAVCKVFEDETHDFSAGFGDTAMCSCGARRTKAIAKEHCPNRMPIVIKALLTVEQAEQASYRMHDQASDEEVARMVDEGWSYKAVRIKGAGARKVANPDDKTVQFVATKGRSE